MELTKSKLVVAPGPGAALRQGRDDLGLSVEQVSQTLRLSPRIIAALESDEFDKLPSPTYVRGYLRGYAQLVGLPVQQVVDAYNQLAVAAQPVDLTAPAPVRQVRSSDAMMRLGTVLVAGLVIGLTALWWSGNDGARKRAPTAPSARAPVDSPAATPEATAIPEPTAKEPPTKPANEAAAVAPAKQRPVPAVAATEKLGPTPPPPSATAEKLAPTTAPVPVDPSAPVSRLVLYVHDDTWVDVRDAQQRRLLYETISAGRVITVEGVAPLSVFLGNVEGVRLQYNGKEYDALRHRRGQVARFTVGAN